MEFTLLEARRFSAPYNKAGKRTVKDYEIDVERTDGRKYNYNGTEYILSRGDVLTRRPGGRVSSVGEQDSYILTLDFTGAEHIGAYSRNVSGAIQARCNIELIEGLPPVIRPRNTGAVLEIYRSIVDAADRNSEAVRSLVLELIYTLNAELAHMSFEKQRPCKTAIDGVIHYMAKNLSSHITLCALAETVHLEKSYFIRLFRRETGKTPIEMLVEMRLDRANDLISTTDLRVSEIAALCGYNSPSFFISEYKKRYGITPDAQRRGQNQYRYKKDAIFDEIILSG